MGLTRGLLGLVVAGVLGACASPHDDEAAVRAAVTAFSRDFNNRDLAATCGLYADDAVVSFPGRPPLGRTEACDRKRQAGSGRLLETTRENGLDVMRRQPGGHWRIHISHAFPVEDG